MDYHWKLFALAIVNEPRAHALPNETCPASKVFDQIDKDTNLDRNLLPSGILPFNLFSERFNVFKVENIERSGNILLISFLPF